MNKSLPAKINVTNATGKIIYSNDYILKPGSQQFILNTSKLNPGQYIVDFISNGFRATRKLVIN